LKRLGSAPRRRVRVRERPLSYDRRREPVKRLRQEKRPCSSRSGSCPWAGRS
jgi:hypothetical protein